MVLNYKGRKKASTSAGQIDASECPPPPPPPTIPMSEGENMDYQNNNNANSSSADFGFILVEKKSKNQQPVPESPINKNKLDRNHRGLRAEVNIQHDEHEQQPTDGGFVETVFHGNLCLAIGNLFSSGEHGPSSIAASTTDTVGKPKNDKMAVNRFKQNRLKKVMEKEKKDADVSILTDVSFLTDASLIDLEMNKENEAIMDNKGMPTFNNTSNRPNLPDFRKLNCALTRVVCNRKQREKDRSEQPFHDQSNHQKSKKMRDAALDKKNRKSFASKIRKNVLLNCSNTQRSDRRQLA